MFLVLPFPAAWRLAERAGRGAAGPHRRGVDEMLRLTWAVDRVSSRLFPRNPCLTGAVALHILLRRRGHATALRIGVRKGAQHQLSAHAWVEYEGRILIGGSSSNEDYVAFPELTAPLQGSAFRRVRWR